MTPFLHGGMAFRAAELGLLRGGNGFRATDLGFLHGGRMFRATDLGFLCGENGFRAAEWAASMEDASFGWPFCGSSVGAAGSGGWNARALWGIWGHRVPVL